MKHLTFFLTVLLALLVFASNLQAQSVGINNPTPDPTAALDIESTTKGVLIPRVTATQRVAIGGGSPATGLLVYDTTLNGFFYFNGTGWVNLSGVADTDWVETATEVTTTKDVGIGITSPSRQLDVGGIGTQYSRVTSTSGATTGIEFVRQGSGQDWRWTNSSTFFDLYNVTDDFVAPTLSDVIATFTSSGRLGIGSTNPATELHVDGTIRSTDLSGTGNRPVLANSSGNLIVGSAPSTQYYSINGYSFRSSHPNFNESSIAYINSTTSTQFILAPFNRRCTFPFATKLFPGSTILLFTQLADVGLNPLPELPRWIEPSLSNRLSFWRTIPPSMCIVVVLSIVTSVLSRKSKSCAFAINTKPTRPKIINKIFILAKSFEFY